jgi:hypothetical protein
MAIILAIEPDRRQAAHVSVIVRQRVGAELILADTTEAALDAIGSRVPDLVLVPALLSPQDDAALNAALRVIAAAAHVRTLSIPVFANTAERESRGGLLGFLRRGRSESASAGCAPAVFAEQISEYLREAAAERDAVSEDRAPRVVVPPPVVRPEPARPPESFAAPDYVITPEPERPAAAESERVFAPQAEPVAAHEAESVITPPPPATAARFALPERSPDAQPERIADAETVTAYEPLVAPAPPASPFEFALAAEPAVIESPADIVATVSVQAEETAKPSDVDEIDGDEVVIDLSEEIEEISPEVVTDAVFDGEPIGVYTMPSFDEDPFPVTVAETTELVASFEPSAALADTTPVAPSEEVGASANTDAVAPLDLAEFIDESAFLEEFALPEADDMRPVTAAGAPAPALEAVEPLTDDMVALPVPERRDDGWIAVGLRHVWAWPTIEGVTVESPAPPAALEELSEAAALTSAAPGPRLVALPKPIAPAEPVEQPGPVRRPQQTPTASKPDHLEWAELIASLRQDIERRRNQPAVAQPRSQPRPPAAVAPPPEPRRKRSSTPVQDEWGFFDPEQCGFAALLAKLDEFSETAQEPQVRQRS